MDPSTSQSESWFNYPVVVQPHHTDYAGVVWHGSYIAWMEEARIAALRDVGVEYAALVSLGCDLPVIDLSLNYRASVKMGDEVRVRSRLERIEKVRWIWTQNVCALDTEFCYVAGKVVLIPVNRDRQRILRKLPPLLETALQYLSHPDDRIGL
ncbi:MAG: acyl-CoA thioesterase [Acaryochloridaceae cyanobacterium RU_4_10]|nr:acyl-CoA thioesterase [Acaryochloridaceae cyanobacterium RU_4_10]